MEQLRTMVARALQSGDYKPTSSARVRAVPDTRTIRYYTTLGLISPPAEMRGRTAYYEETHLFQLVAIKRLQAQNKSLSEIQRQLVGLPKKQLETLAKLAADFWPAADEYLEKGGQPNSVDSAAQPSSEQSDESTTASVEPTGYWLTPAALPVAELAIDERSDQAKGVTGTLLRSLRIQLSGGIELTVQVPSGNDSEQKEIDWEALSVSLNPLMKELRRQRLVR